MCLKRSKWTFQTKLYMYLKLESYIQYTACSPKLSKHALW
jgi:hypothetical protein